MRQRRRDVCRQVLREHSAALVDERSQLISWLERVEEEKTSLSAPCDQPKCQLSELLGTEQERQGRERRQLQTEDTASKPEPSAGVFLFI
ncbi:hypothetical protein R3I93_005846 [Phoxinus phoxinus]|uniref:Uncharacterized protein n=1 Tax=Phoxinus phoxinus TaxID=58324 RepID=A0AAN9HB33_9TELE